MDFSRNKEVWWFHSSETKNLLGTSKQNRNSWSQPQDAKASLLPSGFFSAVCFCTVALPWRTVEIIAGKHSKGKSLADTGFSQFMQSVTMKTFREHEVGVQTWRSDCNTCTSVERYSLCGSALGGPDAAAWNEKLRLHHGVDEEWSSSFSSLLKSPECQMSTFTMALILGCSM